MQSDREKETHLERRHRRREERDFYFTSLGGHDNIVCCESAYEGARHVYIVMELLQGGELFDRIVERGKYSEKDAADCFRTIVETIQHCHELGVVHRDLKPEKVERLRVEVCRKIKCFTTRTICAIETLVCPRFSIDFGLSSDVKSFFVDFSFLFACTKIKCFTKSSVPRISRAGSFAWTIVRLGGGAKPRTCGRAVLFCTFCCPGRAGVILYILGHHGEWHL